MRTRVLILPAIRNVDAFRATLARTAFHLAHAEPEEISFIVHTKALASVGEALETSGVPPDMDPEIATAIDRIRPTVRLRDAAGVNRDALAAHADFVAVWDMPTFMQSDWVVERSRRPARISFFDVDATTNHREAAEFALLAERLTRPSAAVEARRFGALRRRLPSTGSVTLLGSGSSVTTVLDRPRPDGVRIVGDAVTLDDQLMAHVKPQVIACADPILHFGPSVSAASFRSVLRRRLAADPDLSAVMPLRYRDLMVDLMPEAEAQIVGVPTLREESTAVLDLDEQFAVAPLPDVLTLLMLPLAATLGNRIRLAGFDGREPGETWFWRNGSTVQLDHEIDAIRRVHRGFFEHDYEDHYASHLASLEQIFEACEARGITVESATPSSMPPLSRRTLGDDPDIPFWSTMTLDASVSDVMVVSIDPDWVDDFGHHGPWFRRLRDELERIGVATVSLASRAMSEGDGVLPTFTYPTTNPGAASLYARSFEKELRGAIGRIHELHPDRDLVMSFYTADDYHLAPLIRVAAEHDGRVLGVVDLMRTHRTLMKSAAGFSVETKAWNRAMGLLIGLASEHGITVTADTKEQAEILRDLTGSEIAIWPMASAAAVGPSPSTNDTIVVYCPAQSQVAKGVLEFIDAAIEIVEADLEVPVTFRMRAVRQPTGTSRPILDAVGRARVKGIEVLDGGLDDDGYAAAIEDADIVVVPYRTDPFRTRTSSVVVEAGIAGKPMVVASGTWGARVATETGAAIEFKSGDARDLARAIREAINRIEPLSAHAVRAAEHFAARFSMGNLATFLVESAARPDAPPTFDVHTVADAEQTLLAFVQGQGAGRRAAQARIADLNRNRVDDTIRNERLEQSNDLLRRAIADRDLKHRALTEAHEAMRDRTESDLAERDGLIAALRTTVAEHEKAVADLNLRLDELVGRAEEDRATIAAREHTIDELENTVEELQRTIAELSKRPVNRIISSVGRRVGR